MDAPKADTVVPVADATEKHAATEQEINPWDVQAARDEQGNVLAFDYVAISKCVSSRRHCCTWGYLLIALLENGRRN